MFRPLRACATFILTCGVVLSASAHAGIADLRPIDIGFIEYIHAFGPIASYPTDINDYGQVTGVSTETGFSRWQRGMIWQPDGPLSTQGQLFDVSPLPGYPARSASDLNNRGQFFFNAVMFTPNAPNTLVGTLSPADGRPNNVGQRATLRDDLPVRFEPDGSITPLGTLGEGLHSAELINDFGQIVGVSATRMYIWTPDSTARSAGHMTDLGITGSRWFELIALNAHGVVGVSYTNGWPTGSFGSSFLWRPSSPNAPAGQLVNLAELLQQDVVQLIDLNDEGEMLAGFFGADGSGRGYFLLDPDGSGGYHEIRLDNYDFDLPDGVLLKDFYPTALNNHGWIAGSGKWSYDGGATWVIHATTLSPIPEPALAPAAAAPCGLLLLRRRAID